MMRRVLGVSFFTLMKRITFSRKPAFDPSVEMGILIKNGAIHAYARHHGHAALGQMMDDIAVASYAQKRAVLLAFPLVSKVITRPAGSGYSSY